MEANKSDKGKGWHNYTTLYHHIFMHMCDQPVSLFEMGMGTDDVSIPSNMGPQGRFGASLYGWSDYFTHCDSRFYGGDIDSKYNIKSSNMQTFVVDQTSVESLNSLWEKLQNTSFDIILDDGLHKHHANVTMFESSFYKLNPGGIYIIEDIQRNDLELFEKTRAALLGREDVREAIIIDLPNPLNKSDNILMIIKKSIPTF